MMEECECEILSTCAVINSASFSLKQCVDYIESGVEYIYLVDEVGRYIWRCLNADSLKIKNNGKGGYAIEISSIKPIISSGIKDAEELKEEACRLLSECGMNEVPIISPGGNVIGKVRKKKENDEKIKWPIFTERPKCIPAKVYVSSFRNEDILNLKKAVKGVDFVEVNDEDLLNIIKGNITVPFVYGKDLYPEITTKISIFELDCMLREEKKFERNKGILSGYDGFDEEIGDFRFIKNKNIKVVSKIHDFLKQIESPRPIVIENVYDISELEWMCSKLRDSKKFGSDNHLYLLYDSLEDFTDMMSVLDWSILTRTSKIVFCFDKNAIKFEISANKIDAPYDLSIDEIVEIYTTEINGGMASHSGSDFFNMILDSHPMLLTIGYHGLPTFPAVYIHFCENKKVNDAITSMKETTDKAEIELLRNNIGNSLNPYYEQRKNLFFDSICKFLDPEKTYGPIEWFKTFYLAANLVAGRTFKQRITPAIFHDYHGGYDGIGAYCRISIEKEFGISKSVLYSMRQDIYKSFEFRKVIQVVRDPLTRLSSICKTLEPDGKSWFGSPLGAIEFIVWAKCKLFDVDDDSYELKRLVRFEDLKLYPRETLIEVCKFLRLTWSDSLLEITVNGDDAGEVDGTRGYDRKAIYNIKKEYMSTIDYYRLEMMYYFTSPYWGYGFKYYDGQYYDKDGLKKLFDIPFKFEKITKWKDWPNQEEIKRFHEEIYKIALKYIEAKGRVYFKNGKPMKPVQCLQPILKNTQKAYSFSPAL